MTLNEKLKAGVVGAIIGDAVGVPYEFRSNNEMIFNPCKDMVGYGTYNKPAGTWSDDSSMILATLDSVVDKKLDLNKMMLNFIEWQTNGAYTQDGFMFDIGNTTAFALKEYKNSVNVKICGQKDDWNNGNGSLMRIFPVSVYLYNLYGVNAFKHEDAVELVKDVSALTHAHEISMEACVIYVSVCLHLLNEEGKDGIIKGLLEAKDIVKSSAFERLFSKGFFTLPLKELSGNAYVVNTLEDALYIAYNERNFRESILTAVNLGKDTDTTASVTGALVGMLYSDAIDIDWIRGVRNIELALVLCDEFIKNIK